MLIKGKTIEKDGIFPKSVCSLFKTGNSNVQDIITLRFGSTSESKFSITNVLGPFYLTTLGSYELLTTQTLFTKMRIVGHKNYLNLLPCTLEKRNNHCTLITEK